MESVDVITIVKLLASMAILLAISGTEGFPNSELRTKRQTIEQVGTKVGCLVTRSHKVTGEVYYINNSSQLYIKDFTFDGQGFGVYFYIALEGTTRPFSRKNSIVVNWPNPSSLERTPIKRAFNSQDIVINLPADISSDKIVWASLWCEEFGISFGDLVFNSKKGKENQCAPGAKRAPPASLAPAALPALLPGLGFTNEQVAIILANPQLLLELQQQGLFPQLQR
jgi:hypothetical protein